MQGLLRLQMTIVPGSDIYQEHGKAIVTKDHVTIALPLQNSSDSSESSDITETHA
jgi:hypothetical protein